MATAVTVPTPSVVTAIQTGPVRQTNTAWSRFRRDRVATAAQLPPRLRREYGLGWTPVHGLALNVLAQPVKLAAWPMLLATARWRPPAAVASY